MRSTSVSSRFDSAMDTVLKEFMLEIAERDTEESRDGIEGQVAYDEIGEIMGKVYKVRPFDVRGVNMKELNPSDTEKLVSISGLIIRTTSIIHPRYESRKREKIAEPGRCPRDVCAGGGSMELVQIDATLPTAKSRVSKKHQTLYTTSMGKPGDRIVVTGIFRSPADT
ncbi:hypothetical protein D9758_017661 [Tetrapyrgos nigripes]|uniref:MCM OB domain-containing protein n=1 Tax=Tetrapyrgos nigripes TaxID=182062 RepID=A0A8H5FEQ0_9AGAR|nr:hypothetical protein D9758_017661 [Tetrapyrgos nigripes]